MRILGVGKSKAYQLVKAETQNGPKRTYLTIDEFSHCSRIPRQRIKEVL
ncbi:hypothetical protein [Fibrella forsythiae]|uniref:Uncharacterized protein n=1 Tax=Fibrella forsythiae TaxID=2817061 RepID=A0ABS3JMG1_9BACT|nr:hypothetical protein [Fibrella forsythiae]MBO0951183.1 hypothetical protein [Fibrella forsythiae]